MYVCIKCNQVFDKKQKIHGKVKRPNSTDQFFECSGELVRCKVLESRRAIPKMRIFI
jgi:hypothetical protein